MEPHRIRLVFALGVALTLGCSVFSNALPDGSAPPAGSVPSGDSSAGAGSSPGEGDDMLARTLALRSIRLSLTTTDPDGESRSLTAEIDARGNLHLVEPYDLGAELQATVTPPEAGWGEFELFIVDGHAYPRMSGEAVTLDDTYLTTLEATLRSPDGPGMWLLWAGTEELEPAAHEDMGGFSAIRYPVDATLGDGTIQGTIWMDEASLALVRAELSISPALISTSADRAGGPLEIRFEVERSDVPPIELP